MQINLMIPLFTVPEGASLKKIVIYCSIIDRGDQAISWI